MKIWSRWFRPDREAKLEKLRRRSLEYLGQENLPMALAMADRFCHLAARTFGDQHPRYAEGLVLLCSLIINIGRQAHALALAERAETIFRAHQGPHHPLTLDALRWRRFAARSLGDAETAGLLAATFMAGCEGIDPAAPWDDRSMGVLLGVGQALHGGGDHDLAEAALHKYEAAATHHHRDEDASMGECLRSLALVSWHLGDSQRADALTRRSLDWHRRKLGRLAADQTGAPRVATLVQLIHPIQETYLHYLKLNRLDLAEPLIREAEDLHGQMRRVVGAFQKSPAEAGLTFDRGRVAWRLGRLDEAEAAFREALQLNRRDPEANPNLRVDCLELLGHLLAERGRDDEAEVELGEMVQFSLTTASIQASSRMPFVLMSMARFTAEALRRLAADPPSEAADRARARYAKNIESLTFDATMRWLMGFARGHVAAGGDPIAPEDAIPPVRKMAAEAQQRGEVVVEANCRALVAALEDYDEKLKAHMAADASGTPSPPPAAEATHSASTLDPDDHAADWDDLAAAIDAVAAGLTDEDSPWLHTEATPPGSTVDQWRPPSGPSAAAWTASFTPTAPANPRRGDPGGPAVWRVGAVVEGLYRVDEVLSGGMGLVYRVRHLGWDVDLAVKSPRPEHFGSVHQRDAFTTEAETWMDLGLHPNIVSCFYVRTIGGVPRVFAEFVPGPSLATALRDGWPDHPGDAPGRLARRLDVAIQLARALAYAHGRGLVHQDVKPGNVLLAPDGTVKLCDFGLARALAASAVGDDPSATSAGMTPGYCSPEQEARRPLTARTDVWSFGATVLELLLGRRTWKLGVEAHQALRDHLADPAGAAAATIPPPLARLLERCLTAEVADRAASMAEVAAELVAIHAAATGRSYARPEPKPAESLADTLNNRGISLLDLGRWREAEATFVASLRADPRHPEATYNLGLLRWRRGSQADDDLLDQLAQAAAGRPSDDARVGFLTALIHVERGDCPAALGLLDGAGPDAADPEVVALWQVAESHADDARTLLGRPRVSPEDIMSVGWAGAEHVLVASAGRLAVFDPKSGQLICEVNTPRSNRAMIFAVADAAGERALTMDVGGYDVWDVRNGRTLRRIASSTGYQALMGGAGALDAAGTHALVRDDKGGITWMDLDDESAPRRLEQSTGVTKMMSQLALSPDATWAATADLSHFLAWEIPSGKLIRRLVRENVGPALALAPTGRRAWVGGIDCIALLWDVETSGVVAACRGHRDAILGLAITPDGRHGLSAGCDRTMRLWDLRSGRCLRTFAGAAGALRTVAIDPTGRRAVAAGEDGQLWTWSLAPDWSHPAPWQPCRASTGGAAAAAATAFDRAVEAARSALDRDDPSGALAQARVARDQPGCDRRPESVALWRELARRLARRDLRGAWGGHVLRGVDGFVRGIDIAADGRTAISGGDDGLVRIWDLESGECRRALKGHEPGEATLSGLGGGRPTVMPMPPTVWSVSLSPDGRQAVSAGYMDRSVRVWDLERGTCRMICTVHKAHVLAVAFSPDGRFFLSAGADREVHLWDAASARQLRTMTCPGSVAAVRWGADARRAYLLSVDRGACAWDVASDRVVARIEWPAEAMKRLAPSGMIAQAMPDSNLMVKVYGQEEYVRRAGRPPTLNAFSFDVDAAGQFVLIGTWMMPMLHRSAGGPPILHLQGQQGVVGAVALSPDGRHALTGGKDQVVRLFETATGRCLRAFEGHNSEVTAVRFSPDGTFALSGGHGEIRQWHLDWDLAPGDPATWDVVARPHLEAFLDRHTPAEAELPIHALMPSPIEIRRSLNRVGPPAWTDDEFRALIRDLGNLGLGWARPDDVRERLRTLAAARS